MLTGKLSIPLASYCEWISAAEYVPNNRPRVPPFKISDDLSESSSEDEAVVDPIYRQHRTMIASTLEDANFSPEASPARCSKRPSWPPFSSPPCAASGRAWRLAK